VSNRKKKINIVHLFFELIRTSDCNLCPPWELFLQHMWMECALLAHETFYFPCILLTRNSEKAVYTYIMYGLETVIQKLGWCFHVVYPMLRVALPTCAKYTLLRNGETLHRSSQIYDPWNKYNIIVLFVMQIWCLQSCRDVLWPCPCVCVTKMP